MIISPTGLGQRNDAMGEGYFGAPRGGRRHRGYDFKCVPGQDVVCPVDHAKIERIARPYVGTTYSGAVIAAPQIIIKIFYVDIFEFLIGKKLRQGNVIGMAQDISRRYGSQMLPHVHLEVEAVDPALLLTAEGRITSKSYTGGSSNGFSN